MDPRDYPDEIKRRRGKGNRRRTEQKDLQKRAYIADRRGYVREAILAGKNESEIARELGISHVQVRKDYEASLAETACKNVEELRAKLNVRYDAIVESHMGRIGDPKSADVVIKASVAQARLNGADAPEVKDIRLSTGATPAEARRVMQELFGGNVGPRVDPAAHDGASGPLGAPPGAPTH
jgi:hypothetical protein